MADQADEDVFSTGEIWDAETRGVEPSSPRAGPDPLSAPALSIARCGEVERARSSKHPCSAIVGLQPTSLSRWQVPEAWAGALDTARILFVSSNPSISEAGDAQSGDVAELYPRGDWSDEDIVDFVTHRFDSANGWATPDGYFRREDGSTSPKAVQLWVRVRKRAVELLGDTASPSIDYAMTEVVHCKSKGEKGVPSAVSLCAERHLDRIVAACPAPLVVVLGARARQRAAALWDLPGGFGLGGGKSSDGDDLAVRVLGGRERVVAHLTHPTGMTSPRTFADTCSERMDDLRGLVAGSVTVEPFIRES